MYRPWRDASVRARDAFWRAASLTAGLVVIVLLLIFQFAEQDSALVVGSVVIVLVGGAAGYFWVRFFRHRKGAA